MKKFLSVFRVVLFLTCIYIGYRAYSAFSFVKKFKEFEYVKVRSQFFSRQTGKYPEPVSDFTLSNSDKSIELAESFYSNFAELDDSRKNEELDKIFSTLLPKNIEDYKTKLSKLFLPKAGKLEANKPVSFEETELLPDMPNLAGFESAMTYWCFVSRHFARQGDGDTALALAYAPLTFVRAIETSYADCGNLKSKKTAERIKKNSCLSLVYVISKSKPSPTEARSVIKDLFTLIDNELPLSRNVEYARYSYKSIIKARAEKGNEVAKALLGNRTVINEELNKRYDWAIKYVDKPFDEVKAEFKRERDEIFRDPATYLGFLDLENVVGIGFASLYFPDFYEARREQIEHINVLKQSVHFLATYCYTSEKGKNPPSDEELYKWLGRKP